MYSVNGVPLDNAEMGWSLRAPSRPLSELARRASSLRVPGRHGVLALPADFDAVPLVFVVETPRAGLEALYALFASDEVLVSVTGDPTRVARVEVLGSDYQGFGDADGLLDVRFTTRLSGAFWRASEVVTSPSTVLGAASVLAAVMPGLSAPVQDAIVRVKGTAAGLRVTDASGAWFSYSPTIPSGSYLRFHSDTGQAWMTTSDSWSGGTDVSGVVDFGGPRGVFEITPAFTDPAVRDGRLTVTTTSRAGATIEIRGKAAYLV